MNKFDLEKVLGDDSVVLGDTKDFREWVRAYRFGDKETRVKTNLVLISYWLNANDGLSCPVPADELKFTRDAILEFMCERGCANVIEKHRHDYEGLKRTRCGRFFGKRCLVETLHFMDILCEEYDGHVCSHCYFQVGKSDDACSFCGLTTAKKIFKESRKFE